MKRREYISVDGHSSLVKDMSTGAILNTNVEEIQRARELKKRLLVKKEKEKAMEDDIAYLKKEFSELKDLIKTMIEKH